MSDNRVLVKLRPSVAFAAADSRANLRPLRVQVAGAAEPLGVSGDAQWYVADVPDAAALPWDTAHAHLAEQLGVAESDVLYAEPDLAHDVFLDDGDTNVATRGLAASECTSDEQDPAQGKVKGPHGGWHLDDAFSQLGSAREAVHFSDPRTRIAHFDTGYFAQQITVPAHLRRDLQRNFVDGPDHQGDASDPDNHKVLDNAGHGTGTISVLAGGAYALSGGKPMGGAPDADIVPLRIADRVVLFRTSAFATALEYAVDSGCDVGTMSMGGLPSRAWRESIDRAYLAGFCLVAAAGNNMRHLPTQHVVYPARYGRVIAACGVMADGRPYADIKAMEGNFGPDHVMGSAIAAYTPNIPWAVYNCSDAVRQNGEGTSAATPQVAAAAALWLEKYKNTLPRDWRRVEAVRNALFTSAKNRKTDTTHFGNGIVRALAALRIAPRLDLPQTKSDNDSFAFLRVLTGLGIAEVPPREQMFNLEVMQRWLLNTRLQELVPNPDTLERLDQKLLARVMEALIEDKQTSLALRKHLATRYTVVAGSPVPKLSVSHEVVPAVLPACDADATLRNPPHRRLRVFASDPSLGARLDTVGLNEATLDVRWESLEPGPVGEYVAVVDQDPTGKRYAGVDLNDPRLLAQNGWAPSEANPQFHQQMTYAVSMATIGHFERALGRPVLWRSRVNPRNKFDDEQFVERLTIHPHAIRQANAFYSPKDVALQFGYFEATADSPGEQVPGSRVYACLSHDIIAHETTHAILDGMHRRFSEATNIDTLALHEGFADIVALFQHFTMRDTLRNHIARTRGNLETESTLGSLAVQFGNATGNRGALRDAIGHVEQGVWKRFTPDPTALQRSITPHARGAILVAAVFDAYLAIYKTRTEDLLRIYTGGTGVLPSGAIHPDLVNRLADEAAKLAGHVLTMCIRALDYVPPVDVTFFEYLRGIITADFDFMPEDHFNYRVAFVQAFRARGIYALGVEPGDQGSLRTISVDSVRWHEMDRIRPKPKVMRKYIDIVRALRQYADDSLYCATRKELFDLSWSRRRKLHTELVAAFKAAPEIAADLGLDRKNPSFEVHELRRASRVGADGKYVPQLIVALTQTRNVPATAGLPAFQMRGGSTLIVDLAAQMVKYRIFKNVNSEARLARTGAFAAANEADPLRALLFRSNHDEPFAVLHSLMSTGE